MDGTPEGQRARRINEEGTVSNSGINHDPLNERFEETWSALDDQDERSGGSDPGMLPPPISVLPASLGTLLGRPRPMQPEESRASLYHDIDGTASIENKTTVKEEPEISEDDTVRELSVNHLESDFNHSSHVQVGLVASTSQELFHRIVYSKEEFKSSNVHLSSKSSPSLYQNCANASKSSFGSGRSGSLFCRICHEGGSNEHFISPCCCRGSLSRVHKSCLERWLAESDSSHCELCGYKYRTRRVPKYGVFSSILAWLSSTSTARERRNLLIDLIAFIIISPIIGLSTILALQLADSLFIFDGLEKMEVYEVHIDPHRAYQTELAYKHSLETVGTMLSRLGQMGIISMVVTMDMAYISWVVMRLQAHITKWYTWYRRNCKVTLIGFPEQVALPPLQRLSSISVHRILNI